VAVVFRRRACPLCRSRPRSLSCFSQPPPKTHHHQPTKTTKPTAVQAQADEELEEEEAERAAAAARGEEWDAAASRAAKRARRAASLGPDDPAPPVELPTARQMLAQMRARSEELDAYYASGSSYGAPAALLMHDLAFRRAPAGGNDDVWPAAVGLADQHVHQRASETHYERWFEGLRAVAAAVEGNDVGYARLLQQRQLGEDYGVGGGGGAGGEDGAGGGDDGGAADGAAGTGRLFSAIDYRFTLHRHWSLYDAMRTSPYVAPRLQTWRDGGLDRLRMLLVRVGLSLEQARAPFALMRPAERAKLTSYPSALDGACEGTVLRPLEMRYTSFELRYGYGWRCSAADAVQALAATLARHAQEGEGSGGGGGEGRAGGGGGGAAAGQQQQQQQGGGAGAGGGDNGNSAALLDDDDDDPECPRALGRGASLAAASDDFWDALRALDVRHGMAALQRGVERAKSLQSAVVSDGGLIVNRRQVEGTSGQGVQVLDLTSVQPTHRDLFRHPLALQRLAHFVRDAADIARSAVRRDRLPLLAVSPADAKGWCCVTGVRPRPRPAAMGGGGGGAAAAGSATPVADPLVNLFGHVFEELRREAPDLGLRMAGGGGVGGGDNAAARRQPFDDAVAYVHRDSVQMFVRDVTGRVQQMREGLDGAAAREAAEAAGLVAARAKRGGGGGGDGGGGEGGDGAGDDDAAGPPDQPVGSEQQQQQPPSQQQQPQQPAAVEAH
jgi:hypothetical protein